MSVIIIALVIINVYLAPLAIALNRKHRQKLAIGVLNALLGWTLIGWVGALVWACTTDVEPITLSDQLAADIAREVKAEFKKRPS